MHLEGIGKTDQATTPDGHCLLQATDAKSSNCAGCSNFEIDDKLIVRHDRLSHHPAGGYHIAGVGDMTKLLRTWRNYLRPFILVSADPVHPPMIDPAGTQPRYRADGRRDESSTGS